MKDLKYTLEDCFTECNISLEESSSNTIKVLTLQGKSVLDKLLNKETYYANPNYGMYPKQYKTLAKKLGYTSGPIFSVPLDNTYALDTTFPDMNDDIVYLKLEVPLNEVWIQDFDIWSDYLGITSVEGECEESDMVLNHLLQKRSIDIITHPEIVLPYIKPEWLLEYSFDNPDLMEALSPNKLIIDKPEVDRISKEILDILNKELTYTTIKLPSLTFTKSKDIRLDYSLGDYELEYDENKDTVVIFNDKEISKEYLFDDKLNAISYDIKMKVKSSIYKISCRVLKNVKNNAFGWYNEYSIYVTLKYIEK